MSRNASRAGVLRPAVSLLVLAGALLGAPAAAQDEASAQAQGEPPVQAQESGPVAAEGPQDSADRIIVTGSRIARDTFITATPVTVVGEEAIQDQAATNVSEVLNSLPSFRPQATPATTAIFIGNAGASTADLRGLGAQRTLVLVNGRRFVPATVSGSGNSPGFTVDLNTIPTALIARSEVVTGGASAAYGSDAVAGVVNLILDNEFEGVRGTAQYGISDHGDNEEVFLSAAYGTAFAGGLGNFVIGGEFSDSNGVGDCYERDWCGDFEFAPVANPIPQVNGLARQLILPNGRPSTASNNGLFNSGPFAGFEILPDGSLVPHDYGTYYGPPIFQSGGSRDPKHAFYDEFPLVAPVQRYNVLARADYEITPELTPFVEASYAHVEGSTVGAQTRNLGLSPTDIGIAADNAFLPAPLRAQLVAAGVPLVRFGRIGNDLGHSFGTVTRDTYRIAAGAEGEFGEFLWDAYYQYGQTDYSQRGYNTRKNREFFWAVDAVDQGEFLTGTPNGNIVCRQVALGNPAAQGCLPLNLFGENNFDPAAKDYAYGTAAQDTKLSQHVAAANIRGDVFELPGGDLGFATGVEYRIEDASGVADPDSASNNFYTSPGSGISGPSINVIEGYLELAAPLLTGVRFAEALEVNGAVRVTDYSTSGTEVTWKVGGTWSPIDELRFRVTRSRDIRAPNFFELFNPTVASFQFIVDPERGDGASSLTSVTLSGNSGLTPERADTFTAGVVISPLPRLNFALDYYDIKVDNVISTLGGQTIVNRCDEGAADLCPLIERDASGAIAQVNNTLLNLNELQTKGIDIEASFTLPAGPGDLTLRALGTYVFDLITVDAAGQVDRAGQNGSPVSQESGVPDFTGRIFADYTTDRWEVGLEANYISSGLYNVTQIGPGQEGYDPTLPNSVSDNTVGDYWYFDARAAVRPITSVPDLEFFLRVDNLFDKDPPNNMPSSYGAHNPVLYDVVGRMYRMGARFEF